MMLGCNSVSGSMKKTLFYIILLSTRALLPVIAQESIMASPTAGCDTLTVQFSIQNAQDISNYPTIEWNFGDEATASGVLEVEHTYTEPGIYSVKCLLNYGTLVLEEDSMIKVGITPFADICYKDRVPNDGNLSFQFTACHFKSIDGISLEYFWEFPDGSTSFDSLAVFDFDEEGIYDIFLRLSDENGCADSTYTKVGISEELSIPNVFTPNGDELNEVFVVHTSGDFNYQFRVFTRNGILVYSSDSPYIRWDGRILGGNKAPEGVYYYVIQSSETPEETSLSGFVYLYR